MPHGIFLSERGQAAGARRAVGSLQGPRLAHPSRSPRPSPGAGPGTTTTMSHRVVLTQCHLAHGCSRAPRGPHMGHRSHRHHQRYGPGCAVPAERHETLVPARSNALEARFHGVRYVSQLSWSTPGKARPVSGAPRASPAPRPDAHRRRAAPMSWSCS